MATRRQHLLLRLLLLPVLLVLLGGGAVCRAGDIESDLAHVQTLFAQHGIRDPAECNTSRVTCALDDDGNERLSDTPLGAFPDFDFGLFQKLTLLNVSSCNVSTFTVFHPGNITSLYLMNNTFHEFPAALLSATNLTLLDLSYTPIGEIPDTVSAFTNLRQLSARQSSLTRLPSNLDKLQSLRWLVLHENRLTEVPRTICDAASLEYINLKDNFLRDLPNCTDQLTSLFVFFFTDNFIDCEAFRAVQPESIGAMCRDDEQRRCDTAFADRAACVATPICHWNPRTSACQLEPYVVPDSSSDARDNASRRVVIAVVLGVLTAAVVAGVAAFLYERRRRGAPSPDGADTDRDLTEMLLDERTGLHTDAEDAGGDGVGAREPTYYGEPAQTNSWTVSPDLIDFDMQGNQVAVGTIVKQTLTITNTRFRSFTYKIYTPSRPSKFSVLAQPMEGEVKVGHTATVTVSAVLHCTTTLEQPVVVSVAYGHPRRQEYREVPEVLVGKLSTRIDYDDLVFREHIGDGCSGSVSKGEWRDNIVAIKTLRIITDETREEFVREVEIMEHIRCPFIVACLGAVITLDKLCLVTEFMPLGSLDTVMHAYAFSPAMKIRIAQDIANGMKFLHSSGILHRDLKPGNVLCNELQLDSAVVCKIADFGTSRAVSSSKSSAAMTRRIGTPLYMAPEVLSGNTEYTKIADVFSFAIMLTEIWNDREPYSECNIKSTWGLISHILDGNRPQLDSNCPEALRSLIQRGWSANPEQRPSFNEIAAELTAIAQALRSDPSCASIPAVVEKEPPSEGSQD